MITPTPRFAEELKNNVAKCYGAERMLRSAILTAVNPLLREYLVECALLYKGIGDLLCFSAADGGVGVFCGDGGHGPPEGAWMDLVPAMDGGGDADIGARVAEGHKRAVLDMKATLERKGMPENTKMVLLKGIGRILESLD